MRVTLVGKTEFIKPEHIEFETDADGGQALAEFAGRACYQSFHKPNPATATNETYLAHILEVGHESVLEHGVVSFYIEGVSRSLTHELVRHRHFSYSQISQRFVPGASYMEPAIIGEDPELHEIFVDAIEAADAAYQTMLARLDDKLAALPAGTGKKKAARQAARAVLPNATEAKIVVTGNYRAWRHFVQLRGTEAADVEIRGLAVACLRQLWKVAPSVFDDLALVTKDGGSEVVECLSGVWDEC